MDGSGEGGLMDGEGGGLMDGSGESGLADIDGIGLDGEGRMKGEGVGTARATM